MVPFSAFSHFSTGTTPVSVNHTGTSVSTSIAFNLPEGESLSTALAAIERTMNAHPRAGDHPWCVVRHGEDLPAELGSLPVMVLAALFAIYVVLGVLYESFSQPLTILSTLPSAGVGALLALMATGTELSLIAFLGILLLIGIVKKNAIMMVDFALDAERTLGLDARAAIARACSLRFRPIMMTTCAAIAGALPLAHRVRRRHGNAPAARHCHGRRSGPEPAAHGVHHSGRLPVHPSATGSAAPAPAPAPGALVDQGGHPQVGG